jgi:4-hydroxybenzoate polyprenyltransferase
MLKSIKNFIIVSRGNIQIASLPTCSLGIVLAAQDWGEILNWPVFLYICLFFIILTFSCNINSLYDIDVDEKSKSSMSNAIKSLGISSVKALLIIELFFAGILIVVLCVLKKDMLYLLATSGVLAGYAYSAPPLRVKKRGSLSPIPVMLWLYFLPILAGWYIVKDALSLFIILFGFGYASIMQGITFINTCEDYEADRMFGIRTWVHVFGIKKTLLIGTIFVTGGGILILFLAFFYVIKLHSFGFITIMDLIVLFFFESSIFFIAKNLHSIGHSANPAESSRESAYKMRSWFLSTRYPLLVLAILSLYA